MAVTETLRALGGWGITFKATIPDSVWKKIEEFGHIAIHVGRKPSPKVDGDSLLRSARYVGVMRGRTDQEEAKGISGCGMAFWLGDPEGKGDIYETAISPNGDFNDVITALLPAGGSVIAGNIVNIGETFSNTFQFQTPRDAIDYVCQTVGAAWRVNGDATLDAGLESDLFVTNPKCIVARKKVPPSVASFDDMFLTGLAGKAGTASDQEDYTNRVLMLAQGINGQFASAAVGLDPSEIPYKDLFGNKIKMTRIIQESTTDPANAPARAQLNLNRFKVGRDALTLSTSNYDIRGKAQVGDYLWVHDPEMDLVDLSQEIVFRGQRLNPLKLRLTETTWPITSKMSVFYRTGDGEWIDLTNYLEPETGDTTLVVGGYNRSLSEGGGGAFPVTPPEADTSVPDVVEWTEPFLLGVYQSPGNGQARGEVTLTWNEPLNIGGTPILDGSHYDIRYRRATIPAYNVTWNEMKATGQSWNQVTATGATWNHPIMFEATDWQHAVAPFDVEQFKLQELVPAMPYEVQIRAVDLANPSNVGVWSDLALFTTTSDNIPPSTPAPPFIAANPLAVQMTHDLGKASGGTFNLERDMHHLELHGGPEPMFATTDDTLIGKVLATYGSIVGQVPVVQTFPITNLSPVYYKVVAVDEAGNKSLASTGVVMTVGLLDSQYISNLTASKITAGTITSSILVGGHISTAPSGSFPNVDLSNFGLRGWDVFGNMALDWSSATGRLRVSGPGGITVSGGHIKVEDGSMIVYNASGIKIVEIGECADGRHGVQVYKDNGIRVARIGELESGDEGIEFRSDTGVLVRANTLAFGAAAATDSGIVSTTLNTFNGNTPSVTVEIGNSGRALVHMGCWIIPSGANRGATVSFGVSGATSIAPSDAQGLATISDTAGIGRSFLATGLNPGSNTFYMSYKGNSSGGSEQFYYRTISVQPF